MRRIVVFLLLITVFILTFTPVSTVSNNQEGSINKIYIYSKIGKGEPFLSVDGKNIYQTESSLSDVIKRIKDDDVVAITVKAEGKYNIDNIFKRFDVKVLSEQNISNKKIIYAYSNYLSGYNLAINKKSNIQIAICDNKIIVGIPIIVGSF